MLIDPIVPRILQARGLSRRDAAAALRAHHESHRHSSTPEATYLIKHALGSPNYSDGEYGEDKYDVAIGKGVRLVERSSGGMRSMMAGASATRKAGTFLILDKVLPATVVSALPGKELHHLIDHPLLPRDALIMGVNVGTEETEVEIHTGSGELCVVLPATQDDLQEAKRSWARMRRDQVLEAGANHGMTAGIRRWAARRLVAAPALALACTAAAWMTTGEGRAPIRIAVTALAILIAAWSCRRTLRQVRKWTADEDSGLLPRLDDMRKRIIRERRTAILEGREPT